jgi:membrane-associated HD superfamily phosphohydrolase
VLAVLIVQRVSLAILGPIPRFSAAVLESNEPAIVTTVLVAAAVVLFAALGNASMTPVRTFKRLALVVLLVSFVPNVAMAVSGAGWPPMIALMAMHVAAWAVTVTMLTRLSVGGPIRR